MKKYKAYKFRLYPNEKQKEAFAKFFGAVRFLYNKMLAERIELYEKYKDDKEQLRAHKPKTYTEYKHEYEWLYEIDNNALSNAKIFLQKAYENFFKNKHYGFPKFKSKKRSKDAYTTCNFDNRLRIEGKYFRVPKIGFVRVVQHREIQPNEIIKTCIFSKTKTNKYYVTIRVEYEEDEKPIELDFSKAIGLDYSSKHFYIDSQNMKADYPKFYRNEEERIKREQRRLDKCVKGSNNREKKRLRLARLCEKVANRRRDWLVKLSSQIAKDYDIVCIENLDMRAMRKGLHLARSTADNSWGMFVKMLEQKVKKVVKIDRFFPSSKLCPKCGCINKELTLKDRVWICECGEVLDRDYNAANNILTEGLRLLQA